jgi:uncharacterized lipoprotein YajG
MNSLKKKNLMQSLLLSLGVSMMAGCSSLTNEPVITNVSPKVEPLSKPILQAMQPDSTDLLKRADEWLQNSQQLLDSVTTSSEQ